MNMRMLRAGLAFILTIVSAAQAIADYNYWRGGDGSWSDSAKWLNGEPGAQSAFFGHGTYFSPAGERPSCVLMPLEAFALQLYVGDPSGVIAGLAFPDTCAVTLTGPSTLHIQERQYSKIDPGRELTLDKVNVIFDNHAANPSDYGGLRVVGGSLTLKDSSLTIAESHTSLSVEDSGRLALENSTLSVPSAGLDVAGEYRFKSGTADFGAGNYALTQTNVVVKDARVTFGGTVQNFSKAWLPCGTNGCLSLNRVSDGYSSNFAPAISDDDLLVLNGTLMMTNNSSGYVTWATLTNSCTVAGRGTFNTGDLRIMKGCAVDFCLPRYEISHAICAVGDTGDQPTISFRNGGIFQMYDTRPGRNDAMSLSAPVDFYGSVVFDLQDVYQGTKKDFSLYYALFHDRSGVEFRNGGVISLGYLNIPVRFSRYGFGGGIAATERDYESSVPAYRRTHDFSLGEGASYLNPQANTCVDANGTVSVDPTATYTAFSSTGITPLFISLADGPLPCTFNVTNPQDGYSVRWVGGTAYYSNGLRDYGASSVDGYWTGAVSGYWSDNGNWGNGASTRSWTPGVFFGETRTVITNDATGVAATWLWQRGGAPFIITGNSITVHSGTQDGDTASIFNSTAFPFIFDCPIVAGADDGNLLTMNRQDDGNGSIVLRGGFTAGGQFKPAGFNSIGGTCSCGELVLAPAKYEFRYQYINYQSLWRKYTELTALKGCRLTVQNQQTANDVDGSLWIEKGAEVVVNGVWNWNTYAPEHQVNGLLDLNATVGGTATQGFYGMGVLKVKTTDGANGATMKVGEGLTLVPTSASWGTMPLDVTSSVTISNDTSFTYGVAGGLSVSRAMAELAFAGSGTTVIEAPIVGRAYDIVKSGSGELQLKGATDGLATRGCRLDVRDGTLTITKPLHAFEFAAAPGTRVKFGSVDGAVASVSSECDFDLTGVTLALADGVTLDRYTTLMTVPRGCTITGVPMTEKALEVKVSKGTDGSMSLVGRTVKGTCVILR